MSSIPDAVVYGLVVGFWLLVSVAWAPMLASRNLRRLLDDWPTRHLVVNYGVGMGVFVLAHVLSIAAGLLLTSGRSGVNLMAFFELTVGVTVGLVGLVWGFLSFGTPRLGWWEPTAEGFDGRLALAVGGVWYVVWSAILVAVLNFVAFLVFFPDV